MLLRGWQALGDLAQAAQVGSLQEAERTPHQLDGKRADHSDLGAFSGSLTGGSVRSGFSRLCMTEPPASIEAMPLP